MVAYGDRRGVRASENGGFMTGPSPVDRRRSGSKIHVLSDRGGIPMAVGISAANTNDVEALRPFVKAVPAARSRRDPLRRSYLPERHTHCPVH
ncbi:transposase [Nocardia sp. CA-084685]|uniref:transposase n=1 Tax=Nocardia sp. CA-084685 TaxID=3239970 RepID=UPI003D97D88C